MLLVDLLDRVEVTEAGKRERGIKVGAVEDRLRDYYVYGFCGVDPIPTHVILGIIASCCGYVNPVDHLAVPAKYFRAEVICAATSAATRLCSIQET